MQGLSMVWSYVMDYPGQESRRGRVLQDQEDISGKIAIVTGSNSGLGKQTALELAKRGAEVVLACRDFDKACEACADIVKEVPNARLKVLKLDLGDLDSIRDFVRRVKNNYSRVDILVNNAGVLMPKRSVTKDGFESNIGVNHLGPFLLTLMLVDHLKKSERARIICVSSTMLYYAKKKDLMNEKKMRWWNGHVPYSNSKLANALFIKKLGSVLEGSNISCYGVCPGLVFTKFFRHIPWYRTIFIKFLIFFGGFNIQQACETILYCALSKNLEQDSGSMFRFLKRWDGVERKLPEDLAASLWEQSEVLVGVPGFTQEFEKISL